MTWTVKLLAMAWYDEGRRFVGLVWWPRRHYDTMTPGDFAESFDDLAAQDEPFASHPIIHIRPRQ